MKNYQAERWQKIRMQLTKYFDYIALMCMLNKVGKIAAP